MHLGSLTTYIKLLIFRLAVRYELTTVYIEKFLQAGNKWTSSIHEFTFLICAKPTKVYFLTNIPLAFEPDFLSSFKI